MDLGKLLAYFQTSPALRLLKSQNAPFVIDFLNSQFKAAARIAIPHDELRVALSAYQDDIAETYPDRLTSPAEKYLNDWCSPESQWLRRFLGADHERPLYQLTPFTEDVFVFLHRVLSDDLTFIGTESRLQLVISTLADLVVWSSDDPENRLAYLRGERTRLDDEIARIESSGHVAKYQPAQIRERFATAVSLLRELQGDFRGVEESFRDIAVQVQQRQTEERGTRGGILEFALDAEDVLKHEDQGVSFFEFVRLILSPTQTEKLEQIVRDVRRIPELSGQPDGLEAVRGMSSVLQAEADKVMRTNQRLSATLRRLLDARAHAERQQVARLLNQVLAHAASLSSIQQDDIGVELDVDLAIESPMRRSFWIPPVPFEAMSVTVRDVSDTERRDAFLQLAAMARIDWKELRRRVENVATDLNGATLVDVLTLHPPTNGAVEVIAYLQIACDDGHSVDATTSEQILVPGTDAKPTIALNVPLIIFDSTEASRHARRAS